MGKRLVITEKPSVARDIAAALGGFTEHDDVLESEDYVVTSAVGHLLELAEPQDYSPEFRSWSIKNLPIVPETFQIKPREGQKKRLDQIKKLGKRKDVDGLINACDAGREGELIYRRIVEHCGLDDKPQERLWLQSMTRDAIRDAFDHLRPGHDLDPLADAAWLRSVGDWLVGMNATRALTQRLRSRGEQGAWSAGRVQTPTLGILVQRERKILAHVPQPYWEIVATFSTPAQRWEGRYHDPTQGASSKESSGEEAEEEGVRRPQRIFERAEVDRIVAALKAAGTGTASEKRKKSKQGPPLPFDLTTLQREANRRFSMSARRTLDAAQRLYEAHKVLTYPRTDSRHLPGDYGPVVDQLLGSLATLSDPDHAEIAGIAARVQQAPENLSRVLDSSKVSDHFAIVPTGNPVPALSGDDARIFDLVVRQFLAALMGPATWATVERIVEVPAGERPARFRTTARSLEVAGFLEALGQQVGAGTTLPALIPGNDDASGVVAAIEDHVVEDHETRPPGRYSEAQLLRMMETAGQLLDDDDLSDAMKDRGLGTPATRADTIERLVSTTYARRVGGKLMPTSKAMRLMDVLERASAQGLASPALTGEWEFALNQVAAGARKRDDVQAALSDYTREVTGALTGFDHGTLYEGEAPVGTCPECGWPVVESVWGYRCVRNDSKDAAERGCSFMMWKDRYGRYIDRTLASRLLAEKTVGPVDGFVGRGGRELLSGTLTLIKDPEKDRWVLDTRLGAATATAEGEEPVAEEVVGPAFPCPAHEGCEVIETNLRWVCRKVLEGEERNGPVLPKKVCHREMGSDVAEPYFSEAGRTPMLEDFVSKRGRPFKGALVRKPTGKHTFEFPEREPRPGRAPKAAADAKEKKATAKKAPAKKAATASKKATAPKKATTSKKAAAESTEAPKKAATTKASTASKKATTTTKKATTTTKKAATTTKKAATTTKKAATTTKKAAPKKATAASKKATAKKDDAKT
ncbi:MAG: DNA topoisomerase III [Alphaproteobacteria bacterium]|nr:DNA topoisomerase III [Alphaproteobacteria bacterium]